MCQITALVDKSVVFGNTPMLLAPEVRFIKVQAELQDLQQWFDWGFYFREKPVIFSLIDGCITERNQNLKQAAKIFDYVEFDANQDLQESLLQNIPEQKRILSWKGSVDSSEKLEQIFQKLKEIGGAFYELIVPPRNAAEALIPLQFQKTQKADNITAYASGLSGMWTQIVSAYFGAAMVVGILDNHEKAFFKISQLLQDYSLTRLSPFNQIFGIAGNPVLRSFSPKMHNGAYRKLDIPALYLPFHIDNFQDFWTGIIKNSDTENLGLNIVGLTSVSPFKETGVECADHIAHPLISHAKAGNLLVKSEKRWLAKTTDSLGVTTGLYRRNIPIQNLKTAVIGCGGAGRTIAYALQNEGANVTVVNRSPTRGNFASNMLNLPFELLENFRPENFDLIVNATPIGKQNGSIPFEVEKMKCGSTVVDMVYRKNPTRLAETARHMGLTVIDGFEILRTQVQHQFAGMTGIDMSDTLAYELAQPESNFVT